MKKRSYALLASLLIIFALSACKQIMQESINVVDSNTSEPVTTINEEEIEPSDPISDAEEVNNKNIFSMDDLTIQLPVPVKQTVSGRTFSVPDGWIDVDGLEITVNEWESESQDPYCLIIEKKLSKGEDKILNASQVGQLADLYLEKYHLDQQSYTIDSPTTGGDLIRNGSTQQVEGGLHETIGGILSSNGQTTYSITYWPDDTGGWTVYIASSEPETVKRASEILKEYAGLSAVIVPDDSIEPPY